VNYCNNQLSGKDKFDTSKKITTSDVTNIKKIMNRGDKCVNCIDRLFDYTYTIFIVFLASDSQLNYLDKLENFDQIFMDGTFTAVPKDCLQLITLRASRKNYLSSHLIAG